MAKKLSGVLAPLGALRKASKAAHASGKYERTLIKWGKNRFFKKYVGDRRPGHVVVIGARTNVGKSHLMLQLMRDTPHMSLYLSLEDDEEIIVQRADNASEEDDRRILVSRPRPYSLSAIMAHIREAYDKYIVPGEPWLVFLDYIQLVNYDGDNQTFAATQAVANIIAELRSLGEDLGFCLVMAAQVVRPPKEKKKGKDDDEEDNLPPRPTLFDLRDSAAIENAATVVVLMHGAPTWVDAWVAKRKDGPVKGLVSYTRGAQGRLEEMG
jgi:replicative DNA helicase